MRRVVGGVLGLGAALGGGFGCDHSHDEDAHAHAEAIELRFAAKVGATPFACTATFAGVGAGAGVTVEPLDFRFYVHDVRLVDAAGQEWPVTLTADDLWQNAAVALLDFEDKSGTCANGTTPTNTVIKGTIDHGHDEVDITGVRFRIGVPFAQNHGDAATSASPLNLSGLFWSWQGGYKFLRIDMNIAGSAPTGGGHEGHDEGGGVNVHLGSTGCTLDAATQSVTSCSGPNRPEIALDGFDPDADTIVIDYAALVAQVDLAMDMGGAPGCMSGKDDPECEAIFASLGLDLATGAPSGTQTAFRLE